MSQYTLTILHTYICYRLYTCHNKIIYIAYISILYNTHIYTCYRICTCYVHIYTIYTPCSSSPLAFWVHSCLSIDCRRSIRVGKKGESRGKKSRGKIGVKREKKGSVYIYKLYTIKTIKCILHKYALYIVYSTRVHQ